MSTNIQDAVHGEALKFADTVYKMLASSMSDAIGAAFRASLGAEPVVKEVKKRERLLPEQVEGTLAQIIDLLKQHPTGLRSEQIRAMLHLEKKTFQMAAYLGRTSDQLVQSGERRATVYVLPVRPSRAVEEGRVIKKKKTSAKRVP
jgi:hypothetical protein